MFHKFIARQLANPSGMFGQLFVSRWLDKANVAMNQLMLEQLFIQPEDRILEVGFGSGDLLERILSTQRCAHVAGVDHSMAMVRVVERRLRRRLHAGLQTGTIEIRIADIEALPFQDEEFTKLCSVNTLYFWSNPAGALAECRRVLRKDGRILLCFNSKEDLERWPIHKHGFRLYELTEVEEMLRDSGFEAVEVASGNDPHQGKFYCVAASVKASSK